MFLEVLNDDIRVHNSLCDGSINVRDDNLVIIVPQVNGRFTATRALVLCGHTENHCVGSVTQIQPLLKHTNASRLLQNV